MLVSPLQKLSYHGAHFTNQPTLRNISTLIGEGTFAMPKKEHHVMWSALCCEGNRNDDHYSDDQDHQDAMRGHFFFILHPLRAVVAVAHGPLMMHH